MNIHFMEKGIRDGRQFEKVREPRFIKTIDLILMKALLARHEGKLTEFTLDLVDKEEDVARGARHNLLTGAEDSYPEGLRADLHRIAELGDRRGLEVIQTQARPSGHRSFSGHEDWR